MVNFKKHWREWVLYGCGVGFWGVGTYFAFLPAALTGLFLAISAWAAIYMEDKNA